MVAMRRRAPPKTAQPTPEDPDRPQAGSQPEKPEASLKSVTVQVPRFGTTDEFDKGFGKILVEAAQDSARLKGVSVDAVHENLRRKLLAQIATILSPDRVAQIFDAADESTQREVVDQVLREVLKVLRPISNSRRGRKPKTERDARIFEMKREGLSYGQIAKRLRIPRMTVQSAFRRERTRQLRLAELYRKLKDAARPIGLIFEGELFQGKAAP